MEKQIMADGKTSIKTSEEIKQRIDLVRSQRDKSKNRGYRNELTTEVVALKWVLGEDY